ncbi:AAA family ATPase [Nocardia terpenica]|uniref:AAA family ATPase n=1 Tax=Nocardia terpenica TaxID=455432 RepID=UPI001E417ED6|nr:AAA family ATPase [Nocardia terpenica]
MENSGLTKISNTSTTFRSVLPTETVPGQPADPYAEQALLGLALSGNGDALAAFRTVSPDDWFYPRHVDLAAVIRGMLVADEIIDPNTVTSKLSAAGLISRITPADVLTLFQQAYNPQAAPQLAQRIRELSGRRKLVHGLTRALQRLECVDESDAATEVRQATRELRQFCDDADSIADEQNRPAPMGMREFLAQEDFHSWLVPGLIEHTERIILTGEEGGGKSVLCSQIGACIAGGLHPFTGDLQDDGVGARVLVYDCENSAAQSRRRFRLITARVDELREGYDMAPVDWSQQIRIEVQPKGIDLLAGRDVAHLEHAINAVRPQLLILGPLYKLHHRDPSDEPAARELTWILDGLRERYGFALLTEAHAGNGVDSAGKRNMRPIGSSLWRRWPEFGFGMRRSTRDPGRGRAQLVDLVPWRGSREERAWPDSLQFSVRLPWGPADDEYYDRVNTFI